MFFFKKDYADVMPFASIAIFNDETFDSIVQASWEIDGPERIEVLTEPNGTVSILHADAADLEFECSHCGCIPANICGGAIVWTAPGVTFDNVEDNDLRPFCSAACALDASGAVPEITSPGLMADFIVGLRGEKQ